MPKPVQLYKLPWCPADAGHKLQDHLACENIKPENYGGVGSSVNSQKTFYAVLTPFA